MSNLEESIQEQVEIIKEEQDKLALLQSLKLDDSVTEEYFHQLCETPLRNNKDVLCEIVSHIFPMGTNFKWNPNNVSCEIYGFKIFIPTSRCYGVQVDTDYIVYHPNESTSFKYWYQDKDIEWLQKYIALIDKKASWYKKAQLRNNHYYKKWVLPFWWLFKIIPKDKKENRNRDWYSNKLCEMLNHKQSAYNAQLETYNQFVDKWRVYFDKVLPVLKQYTDNIYEYEQKNGCCTKFFEKVQEEIQKSNLTAN